MHGRGIVEEVDAPFFGVTVTTETEGEGGESGEEEAVESEVEDGEDIRSDMGIPGGERGSEGGCCHAVEVVVSPRVSLASTVIVLASVRQPPASFSSVGVGERTTVDGEEDDRGVSFVLTGATSIRGGASIGPPSLGFPSST